MPFSPANLRQARERSGLSLTELAAAVGRSYVSVVAYESGERTPSVGALDGLAQALHVHPGDLFDDVEVPA